MSKKLSVKHLLGIKQLTPDDIELILTTADQFKDVINRPIKKVPSLRDITIANLFFENSKHIDAKIINAGDGAHEHPTQALLDAYSIREKHGVVAGKKVVIVGDILHSRVALSNIFCLQKLGAEVMVCGPRTLMPKYISSLGVKVEYNLRKALEWCDVANMLRIQLERQDIKFFPTLREYTMLFGLNKQMLDSLDKEII